MKKKEAKTNPNIKDKDNGVEKYIVRDSIKSDMTMSFSNKVQVAINTACSMSQGKEWSAIIFYVVKNLEKGFKDMHIDVIDMLVMDIGNEVHTSWEYNDDINEYMISNDLLDNDICMGQLHSHVNMNAFFSGEDMGTLKQEAMDREHNLSVVVNNMGAVVAKISRRILRRFTGQVDVSYPSFNEKVIKESMVIDNTENIIEFYDVTFKRVIDSSVKDRMISLFKKRSEAQYNKKSLFDREYAGQPGNNKFDTKIDAYIPEIKEFINTVIKFGFASKGKNGSISISSIHDMEDTTGLDEVVVPIIEPVIVKRILKKILYSYKDIFSNLNKNQSDELYDMCTDAMQQVSVDVDSFSMSDFETTIVKEILSGDESLLKQHYNKYCYDMISTAEFIYLYYSDSDFYTSYLCQYLSKCCNVSFRKYKQPKKNNK